MGWTHLVDRCLSKDTKAEFEFYERIRPILFSACRKYRKDEYEIEESVSNAFTHILLNLKKWKRNIPFLNWAGRVASNSFIDDLRAQNRYQSDIDPHADEDFRTDDAGTDWGLEDEDVKTLINELPGIQPIIFKLYVEDGFSHREIGQMLDMKANTSKWHLSKARQNLRSLVRQKT